MEVITNLLKSNYHYKYVYARDSIKTTNIIQNMILFYFNFHIIISIT